ncbi:glycosyltransferase family 2 protein [Planctomycetes bacterium K23_9]|uniref:Poly-beta-1,6-N-acetyl-D-glucosamine synthase n=1 Tax=Stieleria marina TaxID=1930275 RepID=A0A517NXK0_9BACT|nr:Poly-beta-1,6-N-acetyl-D-glucosamine synthase [Planctomycetes bacterium K23_9]
MDTILKEWTYWISSLHLNELLLILSPILLVDGPRYLLGSLLIALSDGINQCWDWVTRRDRSPTFSHAPSVCVIIAGLNEADSLPRTLESLLGTYPGLQTIVVDDGSTDEMTQVANDVAVTRNDLSVITMPTRGGKSSALNAALPFTSADIVICVDSDSHLAENAIWEVVQPFADASVAAVSGSIQIRNSFTNLVSRFQSLEYMRCIFIGRMFTCRLGTLGIASGAFAAFRREVIAQMGAWDVGPGEDADLVLRIRKAGHNVVFAPYAQCLTNAVTKWSALTRQRRRWEWAVVTLEMRKHLDLANPLQKNFRFNNLLMLMDRWAYSVVLQYSFAAYIIWVTWHFHEHTLFQFGLFYAVYVCFEILQLLVVLLYSMDRRTVLKLAWIMPFMPFYYLYLRLITLWAVTEELVDRPSYRDSFVPQHVRQVTWHW